MNKMFGKAGKAMNEKILSLWLNKRLNEIDKQFKNKLPK